MRDGSAGWRFEPQCVEANELRLSNEILNDSGSPCSVGVFMIALDGCKCVWLSLTTMGSLSMPRQNVGVLLTAVHSCVASSLRLNRAPLCHTKGGLLSWLAFFWLGPFICVWLTAFTSNTSLRSWPGRPLSWPCPGLSKFPSGLVWTVSAVALSGPVKISFGVVVDRLRCGPVPSCQKVLHGSQSLYEAVKDPKGQSKFLRGSQRPQGAVKVLMRHSKTPRGSQRPHEAFKDPQGQSKSSRGIKRLPGTLKVIQRHMLSDN